jgi:protein-S-isoprenylcysteine O-methyltransferase Ste14
MNFLIQRIRLDLQFSRIFLCDFLAASAYAVATIYMLQEVALPVDAVIEIGALALLIVAAQAVKIAGVILLEKRGGDAREFAGSQTLVTDGAYAFSRNPVYLVTLIQSGLWSLLLLRGALLAPISLVLILAATLIPVGHFLSIDRLVIPNEEAALRRVHPEAFAAYARRVNRWFGRRAP